MALINSHAQLIGSFINFLLPPVSVWPEPHGDETRHTFRGIVKRFIEDERGPVGLEVLATTCSGLWQKPRQNPSAVRGHLRPWSTGPSLFLCRSSLDDLYGPDMAMPGTK